MKLPNGILCTLLLGATAGAQVRDWQAVEHLKPGTTVLVASGPTIDRCRIESADGATLRCIEDGARLVFPQPQVDEVYRVKRRGVGLGTWLELGLAGVLIGGLIALSPEAIVIGFIGLGCALGVSTASDNQTAMRAWMGVPSPPPREREIRQLIYTRTLHRP